MPKIKETIMLDRDEYLSKAVEIAFEVYCYNCNTGICKNTRYINNTMNAFETHCENCDKENEEEKNGLEKTIAELEGNAAELERTIAGLEDRITELERELEKISDEE